jgi:hypothetical protein
MPRSPSPLLILQYPCFAHPEHTTLSHAPMPGLPLSNHLNTGVRLFAVQGKPCTPSDRLLDDGFKATDRDVEILVEELWGASGLRNLAYRARIYSISIVMLHVLYDSNSAYRAHVHRVFLILKVAMVSAFGLDSA